MSAPSTYTDELAAHICEEIAGGRSVRSICTDEGMPSKTTVMRWLAQNEDFAKLYAAAKAMQAELLADELIEIADDGTNDWMERHGRNGEVTGVMINEEAVQRSKIRVSTRQWMLTRLLPKKYGDKIHQEITGKDGGPVVIAGAATDADL